MRLLYLFLFLGPILYNAQDSVYARKVIKDLSSKKYFGRGYTKNGLLKASAYLVKECQKNGSLPLFNDSYTQVYMHPINTFPGAMQIKINNKLLIPGVDYIMHPRNPSLKGNFSVSKTDSVTYAFNENNFTLKIIRQDKLTHSLALKQVDNNFILFIHKKKCPDEITKVKINVKAAQIPDFKSVNVASYIEGINNDSLIIVCAHYDHLGGMGTGCYFPGANDNASGVSMLLNLMKHYQGQKPRYKTVFIFFSGEEAGLLGSEYFVNNSPVTLPNIKFLINLDLLGTGEDGIMTVNGAVFEKEFAKLQEINSNNNYLKEVKKRGKASNSDHYWFTEKGVPAFFLYTLGGVTHYHDVYDREETLPLTKYKEVFKLITDFVNQL